MLNESPATANHEHRRLWANAIFLNPSQHAVFFAPGTLSNPTLAAAAGNPPGDSGTPISDGDMDYVVSSLFDQYASQYAAQQWTGPQLQL